MDWSWSWTVGSGANFGDNPFFDWVRVACVIIGMLLLMAIGRVLIESRRRDVTMPPTQAARFLALIVLDISVSLTEVAVVGTPATPRLIFNVVGAALGLYGVHGMRQKQRRTPPVR